jgi:hypothetical protein
VAARAPWLFACLLSIAALVGGCGGGDEDETTTTDPTVEAPARDEARFLGEAEQVCEPYSKRIVPEIALIASKYQTRGLTTTDIETRSPLARRMEDDLADVLPVLQAMVRELRAIRPPAGKEDAANAVLDEYEAAMDRAVAMPLLVTDPSFTYSIDEVEEEQALQLCDDVFSP